MSRYREFAGRAQKQNENSIQTNLFNGAYTTMLGIGEKFPDFKVTATISLEKGKEFKEITNEDYAGKWKVYFFWPKDFTFVCPLRLQRSAS